MHTVELLDEALALAQRLGYAVRHEWLGGSEGGACEFAGRKWLFVDLALHAAEQLDQVVEALLADPGLKQLDLTPAMRRLLGVRTAA